MSDLKHKYTIRLNNNVLQVRILKNFEKQRYIWEATRHCNAEYELHIVLKGRIPVEVEDNHLLLEVRQGILIPPGQYHAPLSPSGEFERFPIGFSVLEGDLADVLHKEISNYRIFNITTDILQECLAIYREFNICSLFRDVKMTALLTSLMISVLQNLNLNPTDTTALSITELERIDIIDDFFASQLRERLGAEQLAKKLHVSERQLNRVIYQLYGMTFQEKMMRTKMDRSAWLLRTTNKKIGEIAELVGYSSEAAFYQAFRKYFQTTPQKYRNLKSLNA